MKHELEIKFENGRFFDENKIEHTYTTAYLMVDETFKIKLDKSGDNYKNLINMYKKGDVIHTSDKVYQK